MREELRKPVYGGLYYGSKVVCILFCGFLWYLSYFIGVLIWPAWKDSSTEDFFSFFLSTVLLWLVILLIFSLQSFPLLWHFKRVDPNQTKKTASILGVVVFCYAFHLSNSSTWDWLAEELRAMGLLPFFIFLILPILIGWGTYRVVNHVLSIIALRLQACASKPENPAAPGEAPQGGREAV